jgi:transcriptional regulator with XRE-family HTH domain
MKKNFNLAEEDYGLGDQTKQMVGRMLEKREIKLSSDHPHVGRNMRNRHQMSQEDLYEALNGAFSLNSIKNYEKGLRPAPVKYLLLLAEYYNVSLESLIDHSPFTKINHEPIPTKLYEYVNHQSVITTPKENIDYNLKENIDQNHHQYLYYILSEDDNTLNLPWGTRLLVKLKSNEQIPVTDTEQLYVIRLNKENHPDYGYNYQASDDKDPSKAHLRTGDKVIITRAKLASDIKNAKYVVYYDGKHIRHMSYRNFLDAIDGVVIKVIFEQFLYNKERNTIPGVFPKKRK